MLEVIQAALFVMHKFQKKFKKISINRGWVRLNVGHPQNGILCSWKNEDTAQY